MDKDARRECGKVRRALFHLLLIVGGATGLKDLTINVPPMVRSGDTVMLSCNYDLEGSLLYSIQWFRNDKEFYRYLPDQPIPYRTFDEDVVHVNVSKSNMHDVTLVNVSRKLTGTYKCEVSAGRPSYHTLIQRAGMEVVDAPRTDPTIGTEKERVAVGDTLRINCTSGASRPASTITWKLNENPLTGDTHKYSHKIRSYTTSQEDENEITRSYVEIKITNDMFHNGRLRLRCTASISDVYRKSADIDVAEDTPLNASITGAASPHSHTAGSSASRVAVTWLWACIHGAIMLTAALTTTEFLTTTALITMTTSTMTTILPPSGSR